MSVFHRSDDARALAAGQADPRRHARAGYGRTHRAPQDRSALVTTNSDETSNRFSRTQTPTRFSSTRRSARPRRSRTARSNHHRQPRRVRRRSPSGRADTLHEAGGLHSHQPIRARSRSATRSGVTSQGGRRFPESTRVHLYRQEVIRVGEEWFLAVGTRKVVTTTIEAIEVMD